MKKTLYEVEPDSLSFLNGGTYLINPRDMPSCCLWQPFITIEIEKNNNTYYNYTLTYNGTSVLARKTTKKTI